MFLASPGHFALHHRHLSFEPAQSFFTPSEQRALCTILVLCLVSQASIFLFCVVFMRIVQAELQSSVPCSLFPPPSKPCCPDDASQKQFSWFSDWIPKVHKRVNLVDFVKSFHTSIYFQKSASIQPRTSLRKFGGAFIHLIFHSCHEKRDCELAEFGVDTA